MRCITMDTNGQSKATGQYKGFSFSSMVKFGNVLLGTSPTGLYIIGGDKDNGAPIDAWIKTGMTDLGISASKRLRHVYLGVKTDGDLEMDIFADGVLVATRPIAAHKVREQRIRVSVGRDAKGNYWSFLIRNKAGVRFSVYTIAILPVVRHHGFV